MNKELKCEESEALLLLEQSGELQSGDADRLNAHLTACSVCAAEKRRLAALIKESREALKTCGPAPVVMNQIYNAAREHKQGRVVLFRYALAAASAAAAVVVLAVGVVLMLNQPGASGDGMDVAGQKAPLEQNVTPVVIEQPAAVAAAQDKAHAERILNAHALVDYVHEESADSSSDTPDYAGIEALAERLLKMEGFEVADSSI